MSTDEAKKVIGGFRVLKDLKAGAGSQGTVYQAVCEVSRFPSVAVGDVVALKVMAVQDDDGGEFARLEKRTAELVALDHPNIVKYHGCFREKGPFNDVHVIVLEFVEGCSLKDLLSASPCGLGADEAMRIAFGLIDGLSYTSGRGIVHRDIKPANVIVRPDGTPKLIDFEVAHRIDGTATSGGSNMIGTFDYMAPDFTDAAFRGDVRSDVFSLGVCLHEMLTGRTPYRRLSGTSTQANVIFLQRWLKAGTSANPLRVSSRVGKLLPGARDLLGHALQPEREKRIPDFPSFRKELGRVRYRELTHADKAWRLLSYIGHGGFGEVFGAVDRATGERVAVKHLLNESCLDRFRREAATLRRVSNAGFPRFVDYFESDDGGAFLVMDYLEGMPGQSLKDVLRTCRQGGIDGKSVLTAFARYARALAGLHATGFVHRDIKPANLYFPAQKPEKAVVMDLGIVRDISGTATVGHVPGTIDYMSPECVAGKTRGGPEADIWALGLCLYEALAGKPAYPRLPDGAAAIQEHFARIKKGIRPDFSGVENKKLRELLDQMCAIDPAKRLRDARLVERRLRIANGENPADLPALDGEFVWEENKEDDGLNEVDPDSFSGATRPTVWGNDDMLEAARAEFARSRRAGKKHFAGFFFLTLVVLLLAAGAFGAWKYAEHTKAVAMAEAEKRAREAEERERAREAEERRAEEEAEAKRQAEEEARRKAEEEAKRKAQEEARRKAEEAKRKAEEAKRKAEEEAKRRAKEEAKRMAKAEEERKIAAAAEAKRIEEEKKRNAEEAKRYAEEEAKRKAEEARLKAEEQARLKAEEEERRKAEEAKRKEEEKEARRRAEEEKRQRAEAERERKEKEKLAREVDKEAQAERQKKLKQLDDAFAEYTLNYRKRLDEALKPGSRTDPVSLQQEFLVKRSAYREARKKLEKTK